MVLGLERGWEGWKIARGDWGGGGEGGEYLAGEG